MRSDQHGKSRLLQRTEGATAVECAIVLPFLLLLICGIIDFGNLYYQTHTVNEAAREGARIAAVGGTSQEVSTAVKKFGNQLELSMNPSTPVSGQPVTVTVTESVGIITPLISTFFPSNPLTVTGRTVMRVE
jgi:Flp pilus assembly protein TadG